jgi:hypothetical protein
VPGETSDVYIYTSGLVDYDFTGPAVSLFELTVDNPSGGTATLVMSANSLTVGSTETVGYYGEGNFVQSGGTNSTEDLNLGDYQGTGTYTLSNTGTLAAISEAIGDTYYLAPYGVLKGTFSGAGILNQTGGTNNVDFLYLGNDQGAMGTYMLQGGTLDVGTIFFCANSTFQQTGGTLSYSALSQTSGSLVAGTPGGLLPSPLTLGAGTLPSVYSLAGGMLTSTTITVDPGGSFSYTGGTLVCQQFNLNGGTATFPSVYLDAGVPSLAPNTRAGVPLPTFNLSAGTLGANNMYLGFGTGASRFSQPTGIAFAPNNLYIGYAASSCAKYSLTGGTLTTWDEENVGYMGYGTLYQSGGVNTVGALGLATNPGAIGVYDLSGTGALDAESEGVGGTPYAIAFGPVSGGTGVFNQFGGTNNVSDLHLGTDGGAIGTYNLEGGTLTAGTIYFCSNSTFNQSGGTFSYTTLSQSSGSMVPGASGGLLVNSSRNLLTLASGQSPSNYIINGGILTSSTINVNAGGSMQVTGGYTAGATINVNSGGSFTLAGGTLTSTVINIGSGGSFAYTNGELACQTINLLGGSVTFPSMVLDSGAIVPVVSTPAGAPAVNYNFASGTLGAVNTYLGVNSGQYNFAQPGSLGYSLGSLYVGYNAAASSSYLLSAGSLAGSEYLGYAGAGTFVQTGGANSGGLSIGYNVGAVGTYLLDGGSLTSFAMQYVGYNGSGTVVQSGGTNVIQTRISTLNSSYNDGYLYLGYNTGASGTYYLSGGTLNPAAPPYTTFTMLGFEEIGYSGIGTFIQSGGINQISTVTPGDASQVLGVLQIGYNSGSRGTYVLSGGTLSTVNVNGNKSPSNLAGAEYVGYSGAGSFIQTGGTNACSGTAGILFVGYNTGSSGSYTLSGGELSTYSSNSTGSEIIGYDGTGSFVQTGGSNSCTGSDGNLFVGYSLGPGVQPGSASYSLSGGTLSANSEYVGRGSVNPVLGTFTQAGGVNTASNLSVEGVYSITGGTLAVANIESNGLNIAKVPSSLVIDGGTATIGSITSYPGADVTISGIGTNAYGELTVAGNFFEIGDTQLTIGIGGEPDTREFGFLNVGGTAGLAQTLNVSFLGGFVPTVGDTYDFLTAGNLLGTFADVNSPYELQVNYFPIGVSITVLPEPTALAMLAAAAGLLLHRRRPRAFGSGASSLRR